MRAAHLVGIDVQNAFSNFHQAPPPQLVAGKFLLAPWLDAVRGSTSVKHIAGGVGASEFAIRRWLRGRARPRLPDFFHLVDAATGRLPYLVAALVPITQITSLRDRFEAAEAARLAAYDAPWSEAILRVLELDAYRALARHNDSWIATRLGISVDDVRRSLRLLIRAGAIRRQRGKLLIQNVDTVDTRGDSKHVETLLRHWSDVARDRVETGNTNNYFAYNVCALSHADYDRIRQIIRRAFRESRAIVSASQPAERIALINLQLVRLDG
jgi:hypothetical protein